MSQANIVKKASENLGQNWSKKSVVAGFDGFIDEIIHVVKERTDDENYSRMETITEFSEKIAASSGLSANIEFVPQQVKLGGNGPIMANALIIQGHEISYIGALGDGAIDPIYKEFAESCSEVISMTGPGRTDALEFNDGKLMLAKMNNLVDVNWEKLTSMVSEDKLKEMCENASLLSFTNWTELPNFNSLLIGFADILKDVKNRPGIFVDLADPAKRTDADLKVALELIAALEANGDIILGLNENESSQIANIYGITEDDFAKRSVAIRDALNISIVVIHPLAGAAVADKEGSAWVDGPYTKTPKLTTGAGDNFNSGFCNGWLAGLSGAECLSVGVSTSGFYVRNCRSPKKDELIKFMGDWAAVNCGDI